MAETTQVRILVTAECVSVTALPPTFCSRSLPDRLLVESNVDWTFQKKKKDKTNPYGSAQVPPRFELGSLDSESRVLTVTPWNLWSTVGRAVHGISSLETVLLYLSSNDSSKFCLVGDVSRVVRCTKQPGSTEI